MLRFLLLLSFASLGLPTSASAEEFVVVPAEEELYPAPNVGGKTITLGEQYTTLKKLGEKDGWVRVEANGPTKGSCANSAWQLGELTLEMWLPASKLSDVTTKRVTTAYDDGTKITVAAGVPLMEAAGQRFAMLGDLRWPLSPTTSEIGKSFEPAPLADVNGKWMLAEGNVRLGGKPVAKTDGEGFRVTNEIEVDGHTRHRIVRHCLSAIIAGKLSAPESTLGVGGILGALTGGSPNQWKIAANTAAFWPDGKPAGHFRTTGWLPVEQASKRNARLCGNFGNNDDIEVCFDPKSADRHVIATIGSLFGEAATGLAAGGKAPAKGISQRVVDRTVRQHERALNKCYEQVKRRRPDDRAELQFTVLEDGRVSDITIDSSKVLGPAHKCMIGVVEGLLFAARKGRKPSKVTYSVNLNVK